MANVYEISIILSKSLALLFLCWPRVALPLHTKELARSLARPFIRVRPPLLFCLPFAVRWCDSAQAGSEREFVSLAGGSACWPTTCELQVAKGREHTQARKSSAQSALLSNRALAHLFVHASDAYVLASVCLLVGDRLLCVSVSAFVRLCVCAIVVPATKLARPHRPERTHFSAIAH
jgi:hypothetical protein